MPDDLSAQPGGISAALILGLAGASAMAGLLHLIPRWTPEEDVRPLIFLMSD